MHRTAPLAGESISARVFDAKFLNLSMRSRSNLTVIHDSASIDALRQSSWANMPAELLRDVLSRIEASESTWPQRKNVVACAGVCKSWRKITMDIVRSTEVSGKITFPVSLKQPGPKNSPLQCFIRRNGSNHTYQLYLSLTEVLTDPGKFLLAARRCVYPTYTDYIISLNPNNISRGSASYMGKLRSNFTVTKFTIHDSISSHSSSSKNCSSRLSSKQVSPSRPASRNCPVAHVAYEVNKMGPRGPRAMRCTINHVATSASSSDADVSTSGKKVLQSKSPRWHEQLQCWCLNFQGRVTMASVKNFQLVAAPAEYDNPGPSGPIMDRDNDVILQFGRVGRDMFTMDFCYPVSAFQAFAICLSSFETKISCE